MWRTVLLSLFLVATTAVAQQPAKPISLFARSPHYSMDVEALPHAAEDYDFNVTITDLATNMVVAQPRLTSAAPMAEGDAGDVHYRVTVSARGSYEIGAMFEATRGDTVVDMIRASCAVASFPRHLAVSRMVPPRPLPPDTYRVGGDVHAPRVISRVEPTYPEEARRARISGIVIVEALIDKTGLVRDVQVLKPMPYGLDDAAVNAVKQWRFEPGMKDGQPVNVVFNLTVNFKLDTPAPPPPHP
ncbi:MAG TPA: energy transducer TonB [Thermoanaerobaculia bacterium]|nr:energy transducer TonB [Thermoanaerobaculia bacterium]